MADPTTVRVVRGENGKWEVEARGDDGLTITFPDSFQDRWEALAGSGRGSKRRRAESAEEN